MHAARGSLLAGLVGLAALAPGGHGLRRPPESRNELGVVIAGPHAVAFQRDHKLYVAARRGAARPVSNRELPLGWTDGGLYTYSYPARRLLLRSDIGALVKVIAPEPFHSQYWVADGRLYFIDRGVLMTAYGPHVRRLASLRSLGMSAAWLQPAGGMAELQDDRRLVVIRGDGSVFASTPIPRAQGQTESISSSLAVAPDERVVAFTATAGRSGDPRAALHQRGLETVYLLRAGAHAAVAVHRERVDFAVCERGANLQWHGDWLLYSNTEGNHAAIAT